MKEKLDYLKLDEQERRRFDKHHDRVRSEWGMIEHAKWEAQEARQEGFEEGREEGREEERRKLIKSLYDNGMSIESIAAFVGLAEPTIHRLLDDEFPDEAEKHP